MADRHNTLIKSHGHHVVRRHTPPTESSRPLVNTATVSSRIKALQAVWKSGGDPTSFQSPLVAIAAAPLAPLLHYQSSPNLQLTSNSALQPRSLHKATSSIEEYCVRSVERVKIAPDSPRIRRERSKKLLCSSPLLQRRRTRRSKAEASDPAVKEEDHSVADVDAFDSTHAADAVWDTTYEQSQEHLHFTAPSPFPFLAKEGDRTRHARETSLERDFELQTSPDTFDHPLHTMADGPSSNRETFEDSRQRTTALSASRASASKDMQQGNPAEFFASAFLPKVQRLKQDFQKVPDKEPVKFTPPGPLKNALSVRDRIRSFQVEAPLDTFEQEKTVEQTAKVVNDGKAEIRQLAKKFEETHLDTDASPTLTTPDKPLAHSSAVASLSPNKPSASDNLDEQAPAQVQVPLAKLEGKVKPEQRDVGIRTGSVSQHAPSNELHREPEVTVPPEIKSPSPIYPEATTSDQLYQQSHLKHQVTHRIADLTDRLVQSGSRTPEPRKLPIPKPIDIPQHLHAESRPSPSPIPILTATVQPDLVLQHPSPQHHTPPTRNLPHGERRISSNKSLAGQLGDMIDAALQKDWAAQSLNADKNLKDTTESGDETEIEPVLEGWLESNVKRRSEIIQSGESRHQHEPSQVVESPHEMTAPSRSPSPINVSYKSRDLATKPGKIYEIEEAPELPKRIPLTLPSHQKVSAEKTIPPRTSHDQENGKRDDTKSLGNLHEAAAEPEPSLLVQKSIRTRIKHLHDHVQSQAQPPSHSAPHPHPDDRRASGRHRRRKASNEHYNTNEHATKIRRSLERPSLDGSDADVDEKRISFKKERSRERYEVYVREKLHKKLDDKKIDDKKLDEEVSRHNMEQAPEKKNVDSRKPQESTAKGKSASPDRPKSAKNDTALPKPKSSLERLPEQIKASLSKTAGWRWWKLVLVDKPPDLSPASSCSRPSISVPPVPPVRTSSKNVCDTHHSAAYQRMRSLNDLKYKEREAEYECSGCDVSSTEVGDSRTLRKAGTESNDSLAQHLLGALTRRYPRKQREIRKACDVHEEPHKSMGYVCQSRTLDSTRRETCPPSIHSFPTFPEGEDAHLLSPSTPALTSKEMSDTCDGASMTWKGAERASRHGREGITSKPSNGGADDDGEMSSWLGATKEEDTTTAKAKGKAREGTSATITRTVEGGEQGAWAVGKAQKAEESVKRVAVVVSFENGVTDGRGKEREEEREGWEVEVSVRNRGKLRKKRLTVE